MNIMRFSEFECVPVALCLVVNVCVRICVRLVRVYWLLYVYQWNVSNSILLVALCSLCGYWCVSKTMNKQQTTNKTWFIYNERYSRPTNMLTCYFVFYREIVVSLLLLSYITIYCHYLFIYGRSDNRSCVPVSVDCVRVCICCGCVRTCVRMCACVCICVSGRTHMYWFAVWVTFNIPNDEETLIYCW